MMSARCRQQRSVRRARQGDDDVPAERFHFLAGVEVPDLGGIVAAPGGKLLAVGMEGHAGRAVAVVERVQELAGWDVPDSASVVSGMRRHS